jgi:hypothetical protein
VPHLDAFVRWQSRRCQCRITARALHVVDLIRHLARYTQQPTFNAILTYSKTVPQAEPMHAKREEWFTLQELESVGLALLDKVHRPRRSYPWRKWDQRALTCQHALILRLLIRVPLRSRNIREAQSDRNLYQDRQDHWHLEFKGEELKVSHRRQRRNIFHLDLNEHCPDLIPHLEEFMTTYRPKMPHAKISRFVFGTRTGQPYSSYDLNRNLQRHVYAYTQKRFYTHLIRTIWATEFISKTHDFTTAAYMLNDTVQSVIHRYQEILEKDHAQKASDFLKRTLGD